MKPGRKLRRMQTDKNFQLNDMKKVFIFCLGFSVLLIGSAGAQGCSDAGFCSVGNLGINHHQKNTRQYLKLSLPVGAGDEDVFVFTPALEYGIQINTHWQLQGKLTANYASGNLGNAFGAGDVIISGTYLVNPKKEWVTSFTLGTKLPLNQSNLKVNGLSLPMQYQSSLGTVDIIAGVAAESGKWQFASGLQQPVSGSNQNHFLPVYYNQKEAAAYPSTNNFNRKGDVLVRANYKFTAQSKLQFSGGLLAIYHLGKDTYIDASIQNSPIAINGSQGLTLNATGLLKFMVNKKLEIGITGGVPLVVRDVRPDGLTRSFVFAPHLNFQF